MFEYGYYDAVKSKEVLGNKISMRFAYPKIIFLEDNKGTPDEYILKLLFEHQPPFVFKVPTLKFLSLSIDELNKNKMVIMMPLYLLKLRKEISKDKSLENSLKLKDLINNGLIKSIIENEKIGHITIEDKVILIEMVKKIYDELYGGIEMFKTQKVTEDLDRELIFEADKIIAERDKIKKDYIFQIDEIREEKNRIREEKDKIREEKDKIREEKDKIREEKDKIREEKDKIINEKETLVKEMAREMFKYGKSLEEIKYFTKFTDEQLQELKTEIQ